jgi:hypothetical protein
MPEGDASDFAVFAAVIRHDLNGPSKRRQVSVKSTPRLTTLASHFSSSHSNFMASLYLHFVKMSMPKFPLAALCPFPDDFIRIDYRVTATKQSLLQSDNSFGLKLFKETVAAEKDKNVFISPLSVSMALGMTYNGANGTPPSLRIDRPFIFAIHENRSQTILFMGKIVEPVLL